MKIKNSIINSYFFPVPHTSKFDVFKTRIMQLFVLVVGIAAIANFTVAFVWVMELASGTVEIKHRASIR